MIQQLMLKTPCFPFVDLTSPSGPGVLVSFFLSFFPVDVQYKDIYLQNKENVITTEGVKDLVTDCD